MIGRYSFWLVILLACASCAKENDSAANEPTALPKPNILLIVLDDMGFSDLGAYGSEIETPNMDRLAQGGMMFTNFHAAPSCSPSRAMLLTGNEAHQAGMGTMYEKIQPYQRGRQGYEGYLSDRVVSVASLLGDTGYNTYMAGKWHLGYEDHQLPSARGFKRSFTLLDGGGGHFDESGNRDEKPIASYRQDGEMVGLPKGFYSTDFYTNKMIEYIDHGSREKPFFGYLAYTAPHWPLQAPPADIAKYMDKYHIGFDELYKRRIQKMKTLGLVREDQQNSIYLPGNKRWTDLSEEEKTRRAKEMAIYAAMIDRVDQNIGRLLAFLEEQGKLQNTLILLMSDNGSMGNSLHKPAYIQTINAADNSFENMGRKGSYLSHHYGWARVSNAPFKGIKMHVNEGGMRIPAIAWYPKKIDSRSRSAELLSVMDVTPTFLEVAGTEHPGERYRGREITRLKGRSMWPILTGKQQHIRQPSDSIAWETWGERAIMDREWKATMAPAPYGNGEWQLFKLSEDVGEAKDRSKDNAEKLQELISSWDTWSDKMGVVLY